MKNDRLYTGIVLLLIGVAFLLSNFGYIDFHWGNLLRMWPVFLVIAGINLLLSNKREAWATAVRILVLVAGLGFVLLGNPGSRHQNSGPFGFHYNFRDHDSNDHDTEGPEAEANATKANYREPYTPAVEAVRLNISGGATSYTLTDTTTQLFMADAREYSNRYTLTRSTDDLGEVLNFDMGKHRNNGRWMNDQANSAVIKLNAAPHWDINVRSGAAKLDFDLTLFKISNLTLNGGAASYKVKLAANLPETQVSVSAGVSEIEIYVPKDAACDIVTSSGLSSNNFDDFDKISDKHYSTPNFSSAEKKIYIRLKGGLADFNVKRY